MGMFEVKVKLTNLAAPGRAEEVSLLVDPGATWSWVPREVLNRLGATVFSRLPFQLADGRRLERDITTVLLKVDGRNAPVPVAFGETGEAAVLGATALESLGLLVDPVAHKLIPRDLRMLRGVETNEVSVVNLFLGWTVIGWAAAMIWAVASRNSLQIREVRAVPASSGRFCSGCGALAPPGAPVCPNCGRAV